MFLLLHQLTIFHKEHENYNGANKHDFSAIY